MSRSLTQFLAAGLLLLATGSPAVFAAPLSTDEVLDTTPEDPTKKEYKEIKDAAARIQAQDFAGALTLLEQAHEKYPELPPGNVLMAQFFFRAMQGGNQQQQAQLMAAGRNSLERAIQKEPNDPDAYLFLGDLAYAQKRIAEAELLFEKAKALTDAMDANDARKADLHKRCLAGNASVAEARDQLDKAVTLLTEFTTLAPENEKGFIRLGTVQFKNKQAKSAFESFRKAVELKPEIGPAGIIMAKLFEQQALQTNDTAMKGKADEWLNYSLQQGEKSKDPAAFLGAANVYWSRDDIANAKKQLEKSLALKPDSRDAKMLAGLIARYEDDLPTAEKLFEEGYNSEPANFPISNQFVISLVDQDDANKQGRALAIADANWKDNQNNQNAATAAATLGWVYYRLGRADDAEKMLSAAYQLGRGAISGDTAYYVSRLMIDKGRPDEAKKILTQTLEGKGPFPYRKECQDLLAQVENMATPVTTTPETSTSP